MIIETCWTPHKKKHFSMWPTSRNTFFLTNPLFTGNHAMYKYYMWILHAGGKPTKILTWIDVRSMGPITEQNMVRGHFKGTSCQGWISSLICLICSAHVQLMFSFSFCVCTSSSVKDFVRSSVHFSDMRSRISLRTDNMI